MLPSLQTAETANSLVQQAYKNIPIRIQENPLQVAVSYLDAFTPAFDEHDLQAQNFAFVQILEDLRLKVQTGGLELSQDDRDAYLTRLRKQGLSAYNDKFYRLNNPDFIGNQLDQIRLDEFGDDLKTLRTAGRPEPLSLTITSSARYSFFWEMLYDGRPGGLPESECFWGFRYPIGRVYSGKGRSSPSAIYAQEGVFAAMHDGLENSAREIENIGQWLVSIRDASGINLNLRRLEQDFDVNVLTCDSILEHFGSPDFRSGILHFACHCESPEAGPVKTAYLLLRSRPKIPLSIENFQMWVNSLHFKVRPLVFLNACESIASSHLLENTNFPDIFAEFGAGGVIATACTIPDNFAGAFAAEFYRRLFQLDEQGQPAKSADPAVIGAALLSTRLHFLKKYRNPLGLAYGQYARSDQKFMMQ